ncbi:hypothetical protein TIFTF001_017827 [Ficus carica]|uniref:Uncharacterized protein n=1 Tax=Ficus carica TaxID=3494 RepID=A0AA88D8P9_FICCA|nr:hypothetical protein TIFTF001_017827 [Ficus carica]
MCNRSAARIATYKRHALPLYFAGRSHHHHHRSPLPCRSNLGELVQLDIRNTGNNAPNQWQPISVPPSICPKGCSAHRPTTRKFYYLMSVETKFQGQEQGLYARLS